MSIIPFCFFSFSFLPYFFHFLYLLSSPHTCSSPPGGRPSCPHALFFPPHDQPTRHGTTAGHPSLHRAAFAALPQPLHHASLIATCRANLSRTRANQRKSHAGTTRSRGRRVKLLFWLPLCRSPTCLSGISRASAVEQSTVGAFGSRTHGAARGALPNELYMHVYKT